MSIRIHERDGVRYITLPPGISGLDVDKHWRLKEGDNKDFHGFHKMRRTPVRQTHCVKGHEMTPENSIEHPHGGRNCKACAKARAAARYLRNKASRPKEYHPTCKNGHIRTKENTRVTPKGTCICKTCEKATRERQAQRYRDREKADRTIVRPGRGIW